MADTNNTFTLNRETISEWKDDGFDYNEVFSDKNEKPKTSKETNNNTHTSISPDFEIGETYQIISSTFVVLLVCCLIGYFMYKRFASVEENVDIDIMEEDTIYGIDFENEIKKMEDEGNYFQCIRLRYLELLRILHDEHRILWLPSKTVTQYTHEVNTEDFLNITNIFMKIRYGNYAASKEFYAETCGLYNKILDKKGGKGK